MNLFWFLFYEKHLPRDRISLLALSQVESLSARLRSLENILIFPPCFLGGLVVRNPPANAGNVGLTPGSARSPREGKWQSTPVSLPGKSHGQRSLAGYSPWGHKRVGHDLATEQQYYTNF